MAYQTIQASPTHTPRGWHISEEEIHGGQSYERLERRGTLCTSGSRRNLPYGHGGLDRSGASPYFLELFDVKHLLIRIGRYQNVITREEVQTGTDGDQ